MFVQIKNEYTLLFFIKGIITMSYKLHYVVDNNNEYEIGKTYDANTNKPYSKIDAYACYNEFESKYDVGVFINNVRCNDYPHDSYDILKTINTETKIYQCVFNDVNNKIYVLREHEFEIMIASNHILQNRNVIAYQLGDRDEFICMIEGNIIKPKGNIFDEFCKIADLETKKVEEEFYEKIKDFVYPAEFLKPTKHGIDGNDKIIFALVFVPIAYLLGHMFTNGLNF